MICSSSEDLDLVREVASKALVTREQGGSLLRVAEQRLLDQEHLVIDLDGAEALSPSFADEFFGGLAEGLGADELRTRIKIRCANEEWRILIRKVLSHCAARPRSMRGVG
jgi:hypothetical protein